MGSRLGITEMWLMTLFLLPQTGLYRTPSHSSDSKALLHLRHGKGLYKLVFPSVKEGKIETLKLSGSPLTK